MTVTDENKDDWIAIWNCEYQKTFPSFNSDTLLVLCTYGVDIGDLPAYKYAHKCKGCVGKECGHMKVRQ